MHYLTLCSIIGLMLFFEVLWAEVEKIAVNCDVTMEKAEKRQSVRNRRLGAYLVTTPTGERRIDHDDKESFQKHVFYPVLNSMMVELQRRFSKPNCKIMKGIQALHPQSSIFLHEEDLFAFAEIFDSNVDDFSSVSSAWKRSGAERLWGSLEQLHRPSPAVVHFRAPS